MRNTKLFHNLDTLARLKLLGFDRRSNASSLYLTDFWNGIDLNSSPHVTTYTGGKITAADADGVLRSSPANVPCLPGCRFSDGTWHPTNSEGSDLFTSTTRTVKPLNVPKALVKDYGVDEDWQGQMVCPAASNYFWNPTTPATQTRTLSAGTYTLSISGTGSITSSAGTAVGSGFGAATDGTPNTFVVSTGGTVVFTVAGTPTYAQVELGSFPTPFILDGGAGTGTRSASVITRPTAGTALKGPIEGQNFGIIGRVVPSMSGTNIINYPSLFSTKQTSVNYINVFMSSTPRVYLSKFIDGTNYQFHVDVAYDLGDTIWWEVYQSSVCGMGVRVKINNGSWGNWVVRNDTGGRAAARVGSTYSVGSKDGLSQFYGTHQARIVTIPPTLATEAEVQAFLETQA